MKTSRMVCMAAALMFSATTAMAGEPAGEISEDALAKMGLAGMQRVSDAEGHQIRGKQFVISPFIPVLSSFLSGGGNGGNGDNGEVVPTTSTTQTSNISQNQQVGPFSLSGGGGQTIDRSEFESIFGFGPTEIVTPNANFDEQGAANAQQTGGGTLQQVSAGDEIDLFDGSRIFSPGQSFSGNIDEIKF